MMYYFKCWFNYLFFYLVSSFQISGQNTIAVSLKKIPQQSGLPSYNIKKTIQDKKGFVWIASQEGLSRFDSKSIKTYKEGLGNYNISGSDVWDIKEDLANSLIWVAEYNSIDAIDIVTGEVKYQISGILKNTWIKCILVERGKVWIGTIDGLFVYEIATRKLNKILLFERGIFNKELNISSLVKDKFNQLWIFSIDVGIIILETSNNKLVKTITLTELQLTPKQDFRYSNNLIEIESGQILFGSGEGFRVFTLFNIDSILCEKRFFSSQTNEPISTFDFDKNNNIWFATSKTLYKYDRTINKLYIIEDNDKIDGDNWLSSVFDIRIDSDNILWLSTQKGLAYWKISEKSLLPYYRSTNFESRIKHAYFIYPENSIDLFVCAEDGFYKVKADTKEMKQLSTEGPFFFAFKAPDNTIIASSQNQLYYLKGDRLEKIEKKYKELSAISKESINSVLFEEDSLIVMGSESIKGIFLWDYKKQNVRVVNSTEGKEKLASDIVNNIIRTKEGNVAILSDNFLSTLKVNGTNIKNYSLKQKGSAESLTFLFDLESVGEKYYAAVYGKGIFCLNNKFEVEKKYSEANGLCNNGVYKIFNVGDSALYITTNNGLSVFNIKTETFKNYYDGDGLHSNAFEEACGIKKDGIIYAGGVNGFTIIDPSKFTFNATPPKTYINRVLIESNTNKTDTSNLGLKGLTVPADVLQTTLHFSGINWSNPERTTFAWRISERSKEWSNIGSQNFINLIGLEHGTYHFQVKAANEDGVWSEPRELILVFLPKWYQTWWFNLLLFLSSAGIIYAFFRYRIQQIKKQHEIRKSIATDLHDDLGSTLHSVKIFANLAINGVKQQENLQQVKYNLNEATTGLRDMIWVLDDSLDTADKLVSRLKQYALPLAAASNVELVINADIEVNSHKLSKEEKRNLFFVAKEAINNSIKYSGASQINVDITPGRKKIQITISDNGKGFNPDEVKEGYGLKNMHYRAEQIKYHATLVSKPGSGTVITIRPL